MMQRIIKKLSDMGVLYLTPGGLDDDWFWIYPTLVGGSKSRIRVVTNDLMRDLRVVFPSNHTFYRWRSKHIMHFEFVGTPIDPSDRDNVIISANFWEPGLFACVCISTDSHCFFLRFVVYDVMYVSTCYTLNSKK